jgi:hypothetical protein
MACAVCQVRSTTSPTRPIAWLSDPIIEIAPRSCSTSSAAIVEGPDAALGEGQVLGHGRVQVVADDEHVEVLVEGVDGVRPGRVRAAGQDVRVRGDGDDVGRVPPARSLGVVRVDGPAAHRGERRLDVARLVQRVRVQRDLHPEASATVRHASIAAGVVPQSSCSLNPAAPARSCSHSASADTVLPLPEQDVDGQVVEGLASGPGSSARASPWWPSAVAGPGPSRRPGGDPDRAPRPAAAGDEWTWQSTRRGEDAPVPASTSVDGR